MRRTAPFLLLVFPLLLTPALDVAAHSPADSYSARADLRVDDQRGLRVRVWFEVPDASTVAQGDADAAVAHLASCLELALGGEPSAGSWRAGDDPNHGLSNGSHTLFALEFGAQKFDESVDPAASRSLDVALTVGCFPERNLSFSATVRARSPWSVESETLPAPAFHHTHGATSTDEKDEMRRCARVVFTRGDQST